MPSSEIFNRNLEIFKARYIRTEKVCKYPKIVACYIVFNEEEYIEYSIKSIYDFVSKIIIIEGCIKDTEKYANLDGSSTDKTAEIITNFPDPQNKIQLIQGKFTNKESMRNAYCQFLDPTQYDYAMIIDGDEVWPQEELLKIEHLIFSRPDIPAFQWGFNEFFQDFNHIAKGPCEQFLGRKSLINLKLMGKIKYGIHTLPITEDGQDIPSVLVNDIKFFHYNYVKSDEKIKAKFFYYLNRGTPGFDLKKDWWENTWLAWKNRIPEERAKLEKERGIHLFGHSWTEAFTGNHPKVMKSHPRYKEYLKNKGPWLYLTKYPSEKDGYKNINMTKHNLINLPVEKNTIQTILADDVLEHFSWKQTAPILIDWLHKMQIGGNITIIVPDIMEVIHKYMNKQISYSVLIQYLYGGQAQNVDAHYVGFTEDAIISVLNEIGFDRIQIGKTENMFLIVKANKEKELI